MNVQFKQKLVEASADISQATGLPSDLYVAVDALKTEKEAVFGPNWAGIGFAKDVPEPGDLKAVDFLGEPLIIAHGRDGQVRVFENACRHRGVKMVEGNRKTTGLIRCPYHAWCYTTEGKLKQTPHIGGPGIHEHTDVDKENLGLNEVRSHVWHDVIFINMDGKAKPFEEHFATVIERWAEFEKPMYHGGEDSSFKLDVATNWKLAVENYCESYHLPFIHPGLNEYSKLEDHENILGNGPWSGQLTKVYNPQLDEKGRSFALFDNLSSYWDTGAEYLSIYPNVLLGVHKDHTFAIVLEPAEPNRTIEHVEIYYAQPEMLDEDWAQMRAANSTLWKTVFKEDIGVVEAMQVGRHSTRFDGGHFSPVMDESTHHFHRWVAGEFLANENP